MEGDGFIPNINVKFAKLVTNSSSSIHTHGNSSVLPPSVQYLTSLGTLYLERKPQCLTSASQQYTNPMQGYLLFSISQLSMGGRLIQSLKKYINTRTKCSRLFLVVILSTSQPHRDLHAKHTDIYT